MTKLLLPVLALSLTACGSGPFANPFVQPIEITLTPSDLTLRPGSTGRVQVSGKLSTTNEVVTGLNIKAEEVPAGLKVTPSTGSLVVTANPDAMEGTYAIPLTASVSGGRGQAVLAVTVTGSPSTTDTYNVTWNPQEVTLQQGQSTRIALNATRGELPASDVRVASVQSDLSAQVAPDGLGVIVSASADQLPGSYLSRVVTRTTQTAQVNTIPVTVTEAQQ